MELSVIIVSWNCKEALRACLGSLASGLAGVRAEVIVVDNASSDGTPEMVETEFPQVQLIANIGNSGFAAANNQGLAVSKAEYLLLLNPDTVLLPGAAPGLLDFLRANPRAGVAGPAFSTGPGRPATIRPGIYRFPGIKDELFLDTVLAELSAGVHTLLALPGRAAEAAGGLAPVEVDWVSGACMLVRRQAMESAGLLDPGFFLYMEELDWCYRIKRGGWKVYILPYLSILHTGGASSSQKKPAEIFATYYESRYKFFGKYRSRALVAALRAAKAVLLGVSVLWYLLVKIAVPARRAEAEAKIRACGAAIPVILKIGKAGQIMKALLTGLFRPVYEKTAGWIHRSWTGGLQAAFVVRSLNVRAAFRRQPPPDGAKVLDAGCGEGGGLTSVLSRRFPRVQFYGADIFIRPEAELPANLHLFVHDVQKALPEGPFYAVYSTDLLEHVADPAAVLGHFYAALAPGGRLLLHTPASRQFHFFESAREGYVPAFRAVRQGDMHLREGFSGEELEGMLSRLGFTDIRFRRTFSPPVFFFKELYTLGERRGIPGTGLVLLPFMLFFGTLERILPPRRGNGIWAEAFKPL